jgi:hypothetical protein
VVQKQRSSVQEAPRARQLAASVVDMAIASGLAWLASRHRRAAGATPEQPPAAAFMPGRVLNVVGPSSALMREQLGSPGQRLFGLRQVDKRTGARVELWRTLVLLGYQALSRLAAERLRIGGPSPEQRAAMHRELAEIHRRHADDEERAQALRELYQRRPEMAVHQSCVPLLVIPLLGALLRRRLAPTVEVRRGARGR